MLPARKVYGSSPYSKLCNKKRNQGRPRLRFKDVAKGNMKRRNIGVKSWQTIAIYRTKQRFAITFKPIT